MRLNGFLASVAAPVAGWLGYDAIRVRRGWSSSSSDLREMARQHPWVCAGVLAYFVAHVIGDLLLPAWLCRRDPLAFVAKRLEPRPVLIAGTAPTGVLREMLDADHREVLRQLRAHEGVA